MRTRSGRSMGELTAYVAGDPRAPTSLPTYASSIGKRVVRVYASSVGLAAGTSHRSEAELAAARADQGTICAAAARATAAGSISAGSLATQCKSRRAENIKKGMFVSDAYTANDPGYRVELAAQGERIIALNPSLGAQRASLPTADQQRGFTIAQGVRAGALDPSFVSFVQGALVSADLAKGFNDAMAAPPELTNAPVGPDESALPRPVLIGGIALLAVGLGVLAYKKLG